MNYVRCSINYKCLNQYFLTLTLHWYYIKANVPTLHISNRICIDLQFIINSGSIYFYNDVSYRDLNL